MPISRRRRHGTTNADRGEIRRRFSPTLSSVNTVSSRYVGNVDPRPRSPVIRHPVDSRSAIRTGLKFDDTNRTDGRFSPSNFGSGTQTKGFSRCHPPFYFRRREVDKALSDGSSALSELVYSCQDSEPRRELEECD